MSSEAAPYEVGNHGAWVVVWVADRNPSHLHQHSWQGVEVIEAEVASAAVIGEVSAVGEEEVASVEASVEAETTSVAVGEEAALVVVLVVGAFGKCSSLYARSGLGTHDDLMSVVDAEEVLVTKVADLMTTDPTVKEDTEVLPTVPVGMEVLLVADTAGQEVLADLVGMGHLEDSAAVVGIAATSSVKGALVGMTTVTQSGLATSSPITLASPAMHIGDVRNSPVLTESDLCSVVIVVHRVSIMRKYYRIVVKFCQPYQWYMKGSIA